MVFPLEFAIRLYLLKFTMYLNCLVEELHSLCRDIKNYCGDKRMRRTILQNIVIGCYRHQRLYEMNLFLNKIFGATVGISILQVFIQLTVDAFFACFHLSGHISVLGKYGVSLIPTLTILLVTLISSKECMDAAKRIPVAVHSIKHKVTDLKLAILIENFSLQLLHEKIVFDAKGFVILDCNLLRGMLSSITTYMVFFIQLAPQYN
ncbi:gustatory receptor 8a-like [Hermetia illucens]|uniref:gustatory receptor 8a-like n=1 Tax=Hermetia illucens TaxID=343691 RepID=UPI0018CC382E|nr:gustatory receptor 8a-like [Hermetia illucens]